MPITVNENGVLYELSEVYSNEGGVLYELDTVRSNEGGVLYEIHSAWKAPEVINWSGENNYSISSLHPTNNGYSCEAISHTLTSNNTPLTVVATMNIKGKTKVGFTYEESYFNASTSGLKAQYWISIIAKNNTTGETITVLPDGAPSTDRTNTQYGILTSGNYDISLSFNVYDTGTVLRNISITVEKST